jgi:hypothetical protein
MMSSQFSDEEKVPTPSTKDPGAEFRAFAITGWGMADAKPLN